MMKTFVLKACFFVLMNIILIILIGHIKISDAYIINKTKETSYKKIAWNLNLIKNHPGQIHGSVLFFGPSLTQGGICDSTLRANNISSINMGTNHAGNELSLYFFNRTIQFKPKKVFLHLSKDKVKNLHPMTPLLYSPFSLLSIGQSVNFTFVKFIFSRASFVLDYLVWNLIHEKLKNKNYQTYGVVYEETEYSEEQYQAISKEQMNLKFEENNIHLTNYRMKSEAMKGDLFFKFKRLRRVLLHWIWNSDFIDNRGSQQAFISNIFKIGYQHNVGVVELYIPYLMDAKIRYAFNELFYSPRKTIKIAYLNNYYFLDKGEYWYDMSHLSKKGAILFTQELIKHDLLNRNTYY
jgi:hypothetical protein